MTKQEQAEQFVRTVMEKAFDQKIDDKQLKRAARKIAKSSPSNFTHVGIRKQGQHAA